MLTPSAGIISLTAIRVTAGITLSGKDPQLSDAFYLAAGGVLPYVNASQPIEASSVDATSINNKSLLDANAAQEKTGFVYFPYARNSGDHPTLLQYAPPLLATAPILNLPLLPYIWVPPLQGVTQTKKPISSVRTDPLASLPSIADKVEATSQSALVKSAIQQITPSLKEQLATGDDIIVLGTHVKSVEKISLNGDAEALKITAEQRIADASELHMTNLMEVVARAENGESLSVSDVVVAVIRDIIANPQKALTNLLRPGQVYEALKGTREVTITVSLEQTATLSSEKNLGVFNDPHSLTWKRPGADVETVLQRTVSQSQQVEREINLFSVEYSWGEITFADYAPRAEAIFPASKETSASMIFEKSKSITTTELNVSGTVAIEGDAPTSSNSRTIVAQEALEEERIITAADNARTAIADGNISDAELQEMQGTVLAYRQQTSTIEALPEDMFETNAQSSEQQQILPILQKEIAELRTGKDINRESMHALAQNAVSAREELSPLNIPQNDTMRTQHESLGPEKTEVLAQELQREEINWAPDNIFTTTTTATTQNFTSSEITAHETTYATTPEGSGVFSQLTSSIAPQNERHAYIVVSEKQGERVSTNTTTKEERNVIGRVLGGTINSSATNIEAKEDQTVKVYEVHNRSVENAISDGILTPDELSNLHAQIRSSEITEGITEREIDRSTEGKNFKAGWIDYIPLGSIATCVIKSSYGHELSGSDYFWATVDGALTVATFGVASVFTKGATATGKAITKGALQTAGREAAKTITKAGKTAVQNVTTDIKAPIDTITRAAEYTIKHGPEKAMVKAGDTIKRQYQVVRNTISGENRYSLNKMSGSGPDLRHGTGPNPRKPINAEYAGKNYPVDGILDLNGKVKYPKGVDFDKYGYPKFEPYADKNVSVKDLTGNYATDVDLANKAAGLSRTPKGYVWHHHQNGRDMLLIPQDIHGAVRHSGGASLIRQQANNVGQLARTVSGTANASQKIVRNNS